MADDGPREGALSSSAPSVTFVGTHDPSFGRISLVAEGLRARGYDVRQCVEPAWGSTAERVRAARRGLLNPTLLGRLARAYARIGRCITRRGPAGPLLVGYPGQLDVLLRRLFFPRAFIVLDGFVSIDETLADRGLASNSSPTRRVARLLDRLAFRLADLVIVDTQAHARRFAAHYGLRPDRAIVVPVGARDPGPLPPAPSSLPMRVLYFGGFVPLHGIPTILAAARLVPPDAGIAIDLVGDGQDAELAHRTLAEDPVSHVRLVRRWMSEQELIHEHIAEADVCLGIFADSPKALDVVPSKLYLALACQRAVVTADSPALREELLARTSAADTPVLTCAPGDPASLAAALLRLRDEPELRRRVALAGRQLYEARFRPGQIVGPLCEALATQRALQRRSAR